MDSVSDFESGGCGFESRIELIFVFRKGTRCSGRPWTFYALQKFTRVHADYIIISAKLVENKKDLGNRNRTSDQLISTVTSTVNRSTN